MSPRNCTIPGCCRAHNAHGYCRMHYRRWRIHGDPTIERPRGHPAFRRFPVQPLLNAAYARVGYVLRVGEVAELFDVPKQRVIEWRREGITWTVADRMACALFNLDPVLLWPDFYDDVCPRVEAA